MRKVCIITSNRADYWLLKPLMRRLQNSQQVELQVLVSGAHLSDEFGKTTDFVRQDGFQIDANVECLPETDDYIGMIKALSEGVFGFAEAFQKIQPDLVVILGDRFEIFAAAQAAYCLRLPLAHLHGGESTQAALDEGFRHASSKFSHLHFVSHPEYKARLMRMGESPDRIWLSGAIGIDHMNDFQPISKADLSKRINFDLDKYILLTYHPSTLDNVSPEMVANNIKDALNQFPDYQVLITQTNPDPVGRSLNKLWVRYQEEQPERICLTRSLGDDYHSAVYHSQCVMGNSSSGILEVPYLGKRTINIGKRQSGRIFPNSVLQAGQDVVEMVDAIAIVLQDPSSKPEEVYGTPGTVTETIAKVLEDVSLENLVCKEFYDG